MAPILCLCSKPVSRSSFSLVFLISTVWKSRQGFWRVCCYLWVQTDWNGSSIQVFALNIVCIESIVSIKPEWRIEARVTRTKLIPADNGAKSLIHSGWITSVSQGRQRQLPSHTHTHNTLHSWFRVNKSSKHHVHTGTGRTCKLHTGKKNSCSVPAVREQKPLQHQTRAARTPW